MDDFDEYLETNKSVSENIRNGLVSINQEEKQLLALRNQLSKIKTIREDQVKKDQLITSLREQIAIYEHERASSTRQNTELHEIMSERIQTLERYLHEKESVEVKYNEMNTTLEVAITEKKQLYEDLMKETERAERYKSKYEKARQEILILSKDLEREREISEQIQIVMENLRSESEYKESTISSLKTQTTINEMQLKETSITSQQTIDELTVKVRLLEESMKISEKTQETNWKTISNQQKEILEYKSEIEKWQRHYHDMETRYNILNKQAETLKAAHYVEDIHALQEEKSLLHRKIQLKDSELEAFQTVINYITDVFKGIVNQTSSYKDHENDEIEKIHFAINRLFTIRNQVIDCGFDGFNDINRLLKYLSLFLHKYLTIRDNQHFKHLSNSFMIPPPLQTSALGGTSVVNNSSHNALNNSILTNNSHQYLHQHQGMNNHQHHHQLNGQNGYQQHNQSFMSTVSNNSGLGGRYSSHNKSTTEHVVVQSKLQQIQQQHQQISSSINNSTTNHVTTASPHLTSSPPYSTTTTPKKTRSLPSPNSSPASTISADSSAKNIFKKYTDLFSS